jgi:8-oxo-dGTP pyrophosphatase MutT (NUDIX family)
VDYEGEWAWTPPSGKREGGETAAECARRELLEETGLDLVPWVTGCGTDAWPVYLAEARVGDAVCVEQEPEHDRFEWLPAPDALGRCSPEVVRRALGGAIAEVLAGSA